MKKFFAFALALVMVATLFVGCSETSTAYDSEKDAVVEVEVADLIQVPGYDYLYYSTTNRTVYYAFTIDAYSERSGYFGPYVENGHFCEYVDGKIVEVIPTVIIEDTTN